jgi:uncharacterized membrane protein
MELLPPVRLLIGSPRPESTSARDAPILIPASASCFSGSAVAAMTGTLLSTVLMPAFSRWRIAAIGLPRFPPRSASKL